MTMHFRGIKDSITTLLLAEAAGRYRVRGYPDQGLSAEEVADTDRLVQVSYQRGSFPKSSSGRGPFDHTMTFRVLLVASKAAEVDLTVLDNPASTPTQIANALAAAEPASAAADDAIDELIDAVFQVIMAADNIDLGYSATSLIGSRWIEDITKNDPYPRGDRVVVSATMDITCRVPEEITGATLTSLGDIVVDLQHQGDAVTRAGVKAEYP